MLKSIRWSLQLWHAGILALALAGFGTAAYYGLESARFQQIDADLIEHVRMVGTSSFTPIWPPPAPVIQQLPGSMPGPVPGAVAPAVVPGGPPANGRGGRNFGGNGEGMNFDFGPREGRRGRGGGPGGGPGGPGGGPEWWQEGPPASIAVFIAPQILSRFGDGENKSMYYIIWNPDRTMNRSSRQKDDVPSATARPPAEFPQPVPPKIRVRGDLREAYMPGPYGTELLVGKSIAADVDELHGSALLLAMIGGGVLLLGLAGGFALSGRAVRPIRTITAAAQQISATNLSRRISTTETESELGQLAAVLNDAFGRLDAAFKQQVRFTADASHELRTPLSVIHTNAQLALSRERTGEEYRKTLETCLRASTRMKHLVDSLLVLARADVGRLSLDRSDFDISDIAQECISMLTPLAQEKHVTLESQLPSAELNADASKVAQVITNLLTNAIRYNREGGKVITKVSAEKNAVILTIEDTGIGIPEESQPHLFERFFRVDEARSREQGGTGLGLAICKSIVEAHGGTITFTSTPGQGTTFVVRLPGRVQLEIPPESPAPSA